MHDQCWQLWFDHFTNEGLVFGFTSHQRPQRFHFQGAAPLLRRPQVILFLRLDCSALVEDLKWAPQDDEEPPDDDAGPLLQSFVLCH